jgi:hypothetical protein
MADSVVFTQNRERESSFSAAERARIRRVATLLALCPLAGALLACGVASSDSTTGSGGNRARGDTTATSDGDGSGKQARTNDESNSESEADDSEDDDDATAQASDDDDDDDEADDDDATAQASDDDDEADDDDDEADDDDDTPSASGGAAAVSDGGARNTPTGGRASTGGAASTETGGASDGSAASDPFAVAAICTSGVTARSGASSLMKPGEACNACHASSGAPHFAIAGTIYPTGHEPSDCNGAGKDSGAVVVIKDADGKIHELGLNEAGNFTLSGSLALPYTAKVVADGSERAMGSALSNGDCNSCHTQSGKSGAPGRIVLP